MVFFKKKLSRFAFSLLLTGLTGAFAMVPTSASATPNNAEASNSDEWSQLNVYLERIVDYGQKATIATDRFFDDNDKRAMASHIQDQKHILNTIKEIQTDAKKSLPSKKRDDIPSSVQKIIANLVEAQQLWLNALSSGKSLAVLLTTLKNIESKVNTCKQRLEDSCKGLQKKLSAIGHPEYVPAVATILTQAKYVFEYSSKVKGGIPTLIKKVSRRLNA